MTTSRTVSVALILSMLMAALPGSLWAGDEAATPKPAAIDLRAAIERAAAQSVRTSVSPMPLSKPAARARQNPGGGGGSSALVWTLVGTLSSLAATYFIVKEMQKETDKLANEQQ